MIFLWLVLAGLGVVGALVLFTAVAARRVEAWVPPLGRFVDVPGARLHVVDQGTGPAVLLIHGLAGQLRHYTYGVVDRLAVDHRVIALDRPGSGYSVRAPGTSAALGAQADVIAALLDALQIDRAALVGHSLGGAIALTFAQRHPTRVTGLALIAPLTHEPKQMAAAFEGLLISRRWLRHAIAWTLVLPATLTKRDEVLAVVFGPDPVPADFGTRGGGFLGTRPSHFIGASTDLMDVRADFHSVIAGYPAMRLPVGVLYGRGDRILDPVEQGEALRQVLPGVEMTLVEGGHMLPVTAVEATVDFIRRTLRRIAAVAEDGAR